VGRSKVVTQLMGKGVVVATRQLSDTELEKGRGVLVTRDAKKSDSDSTTAVARSK
jgi:hypothetical protein